uniref:TetR family transcriptional regulator n=1 Tax=Thermocrispum agreste TaxID=37925 RepID=A0A2W4L7I1_9PSEU|nr:MAG: TetR family transcriptional regulator [Thermocrispum agreste]
MTRVRQPQQERSIQTRRRLLEAAVAALGELGWSGTTVAVVAERAGVSRGAAQHHFPTREDLVTAAMNYMSEAQHEDLERRAAELPTGPGRRRAVIEMLLNLYAQPAFVAALHLWVAAATDERLAEKIKPLEREVGRRAHKKAVELLEVDESKPGVRETVQATLDLARGLGLANLLTAKTPRRHPLVPRCGRWW